MSGQTIEQLGLGFAPASRDGLKARLLKQGFPHALLLQSGLVVQRDSGEVVDRFRNRLMVPICRDTGSVIAFGGRAMEPDQAAEVPELAGNADLLEEPDALRPEPDESGDPEARVTRCWSRATSTSPRCSSRRRRRWSPRAARR